MHVFLHSRCINMKVHIYYWSLFSVTLLGVGWRGGYSYHFSPSKTGTVGFYPFLFIFPRCISAPWPFGETLRITLRYWGFHILFLLSSVFRRRLQSFQRIFFRYSDIFWRVFDVCFLWFLIHVWSGHLFKDSAIGVFKGWLSPTALEGVLKLSVNPSSCSRASWLDYFLLSDPPIMSEVSAHVFGFLFCSALLSVVSCYWVVS